MVVLPVIASQIVHTTIQKNLLPVDFEAKTDRWLEVIGANLIVLICIQFLIRLSF